MTTLVWHRGDLRLHDHAALHAAARTGVAVAGVVVLDPAILDRTSARRRALFYRNVSALRRSYEARGGRLFVRRGTPDVALPVLARDLRAGAVHALRSYTPYGVLRDTAADAALALSGVPTIWHHGLYVHNPGAVLTRNGRPFSVYGSYARRWLELEIGDELETPGSLSAPRVDISDGDIPAEESDAPLPEAGEAAALERLRQFVELGLASYAQRRNLLDGSGTSRLSIDLTLGTLSARVAFHAVAGRPGAGARRFIGELAWRDFMADILYHRPHLADAPFDARYARMEWHDDDAAFAAWQHGETGVPVVDAAMRELQATGWISNRARMVAAQFLSKHLRIDWRRGERAFRHLLLDGDAASNIGNWQWAAGLGIDNVPYFRVFNPVTQGKEHDPEGRWLMKWVPESFGDPQPLPHAIVDIAQARREYLAAMEGL